jgi:hypothetical protein
MTTTTHPAFRFSLSLHSIQLTAYPGDDTQQDFVDQRGLVQHAYVRIDSVLSQLQVGRFVLART